MVSEKEDNKDKVLFIEVSYDNKKDKVVFWYF